NAHYVNQTGVIHIPEWKDGFDQARHERRLEAVRGSAWLGVSTSPCEFGLDTREDGVISVIIAWGRPTGRWPCAAAKGLLRFCLRPVSGNGVPTDRSHEEGQPLKQIPLIRLTLESKRVSQLEQFMVPHAGDPL